MTGSGLADLVRNKQVSASGIAGRGDRPHRQGRSADQRRRRQALRLCRSGRSTRGLPDGPFTGVPFLLKDLDILEGTRTTFGASVYKDNVADHTGTLAQRFLDAGVTIFGKSASPGIRPDADHRVAPVRSDPESVESGAFLGRLVRRRGRGGRGAHSARRACQRRRRLDPHSGFRLRRVRIEADPGAQPARARSRRRLGRIFLRPCRAASACATARRCWTRSTDRSRRAPMWRRRRSGHSSRRSAAIPAGLRIAFTDKSPYGDAIDPEIAAATREIAALLAGLGHHVEERAPVARRRSGGR